MEWREVVSNSNYEVSDIGLVRRKGKPKNLAFSRSSRGFTTYLRVTLFRDNQREYKQVHRLVGEAFLPKVKGNTQIDHIDGNGENNNVSNLEWVSPSENIIRSFKNNIETKLAICSKGGKEGAIKAQEKAELRYKGILGDRFLGFHKGGSLIKDAAVSYVCHCGVERTASIMWKELRNHGGKCPKCTGTVNRSSPSLI